MNAREVFLTLLDTSLTDGTVRFQCNGESRLVGRCTAPPERCGDNLAVRVQNDRVFSRTLSYGNLGFAESYMDGDFEVEGGKVAELLTLLLRNGIDRKMRRHPMLVLRAFLIQAFNRLRGNRRNVQYHYDVGADLFQTFLDRTLTYSCGYAEAPGDDLEQLQLNKLERICHKLELTPGDRLLDIGCGFGGLLIHAAKKYGTTGTGITISRVHCNGARAAVQAAGLSHRITIALNDHRQVTGEFDRVVSVGMMEHLPRSEYGAYFTNIGRVMTSKGRGLVHTIASNFRNDHDPFIQKYIFPGSAQPSLAEIAGHLEQHHLAILDVENIVRHYAHTARAWLTRFRANAHLLDQQKYNERFQRMWEYYLCCAIAGAEVSDSAVYQVLFAKDHAGVIQLQRI